MGLRAYFKKNATAITATIILAGGGAVGGVQVSRDVVTPDESPYTLAQYEKTNAGMDHLMSAEMPRGTVIHVDAKRADTLRTFNRDIDAIKSDQLLQGNSPELQRRTLAVLDSARLSPHLNETDYKNLSQRFDAKAKGASYRQECIIATEFAQMFSDEDQTAAQKSQDVASCMAEGADKMVGPFDTTGGLGGLALGGLLSIPFWRRRKPPQ